MKKIQIFRIVIIALIFLASNAIIHAQSANADKNHAGNDVITKEVKTVLDLWNSTAKSRDTTHFMELFDNSNSIMLVGSDSGEVFKGKKQIEGWVKMLFAHRGFSWEMNRLDIDHNGNTAWVFMDGFMIVTNDKGKTAKFPYRFTGILVKSKSLWKWRLFDGSVPGGH
jgi:hypothetical protein